jgi:periplasmic protein TonB
MQTNKILSASLIDIVFDGRGKEYGAYELRRNYSKRINTALWITITMAALLCGGAIIAGSSQQTARYRISDVVKLADLPDEKKIEPPIEKPKLQKEQVKTEAFTEIVIKPNDVVNETPPTQENLITAAIGAEDIDGPDDTGTAEPVDLDKGRGIVDAPVTQSIDDTPLMIVEVDAKFLGNWTSFLLRNLNGNVPLDNGAPFGRYSVVIQFVVDKEGVVSDITPLTNHGYGMEAEAVRVLKKATKWEPAIQNGHKVKAYRKQVIVFEINEE